MLELLNFVVLGKKLFYNKDTYNLTLNTKEYKMKIVMCGGDCTGCGGCGGGN